MSESDKSPVVDVVEDADRIRYVGDMRRLAIKPGDRLVLTLNQHLPESAVKRLEQQLSDFCDGAKVLVLDPGMTLGAFGFEADDAEQS